MSSARTLWLFLALASSAPLLPAPRAAADPVVGQWTPVMPWPDKAVHSALLHTGKVLWYRGEGTNAQSYLWDPATLQLESQPFNPNIFCSGLSTLPDGRVLVSGGRITGSRGPRHCFIFDPVANTWTRGPDFRLGRYYPTNLQLGDGRTLVFSGYDESAVVNEQVESYTMGASQWELLAGANRFMAYYPRMHLLPSGKVFHVGKEALSETFDPATNSWQTGAESNFGSRSHGTSVLLPLPGLQKVMILGDDGETNTCETIDLSAANPTWTYTAPMRYPRGDLSAVIMPDATVLVAGGVSGGPEYPVELYDPVANTWKLLAPMHSERKYHSSAVLLPDGRVLVAGADNNHTAEVFSPPYLFQGPRPVIGSAPASVQYGASFQLQSGEAASITSVVLIRPGAATHAQDMQQRYVPLTFHATSGGTLDVTAPSDPNVAPPGYYMIFILRADKVPSVAKFVLLGGTAPEPPPDTNLAPTVDAGPTQTITLPVTSVTLNGSVLDDGLPASPGACVTHWTMSNPVTGVTFANDLALGTTATFSAPGTYELRLSAYDGELTGSDVVTIVVRSNCGDALVLDRPIAAGADDAEEKTSGSVSLTSSDLEFVDDGGLQTVGLRFTGITIPQGSTVTSAYIQLTADEAQTEATSLRIHGQDADSALTFTSASRNVSARPRTDAFVAWSPPAWTSNAAGPAQRTPDLAAVIQEIVDRPNWSARSLAFIFTGTGHRTSEAFEGTAAPRLHVEIACGTTNRKPVVDAGPSQTITLPATATLSGAASDDGLPSGTLSHNWSQVDGSGEVEFDDDQALITTVRFPASGVYTLRLAATDGELTTSDEVVVDVRQPGAVEIFERRVAAGSDDAEEKPSGSVSLTSSDLELVYDGGNQTIGMRFSGINVPRGARIANAYLQFTSDEAHTEVTSLTIFGQAADNAAAFTSAKSGISSRARVGRSVPWTPPAWTAGATAAPQKTPDLSVVIQEIVNRPNWASGNALVLIVTGTGHRTADAFEGGSGPLLHLEFGSTGATDDHVHGSDLSSAIGRLGPLYPNPGPSTRTLHFELARDTDVQLEVYDLRGALVRRIASGHRRSGQHAVWWDGRDGSGRRLANGVYWVRFSAAGQRATRKLVILE